MVESDDYVGGAAVQHREVEGHEGEVRTKNSHLPIEKLDESIELFIMYLTHVYMLDLMQKFLSYFDKLTYLQGGVASGFNHVEPTEETPFLYRIKGTTKNMSLTQMPLSKNSLNSGDAFILYASPAKVWLWKGESAGPNEKFKANTEAEKLCTQGTVQVMEQGDGDDAEEFADFWNYLGEGDIQPATPDDTVREFVPVLYQVKASDDEPVEVAKADAPAHKGQIDAKLPRSLLNESDVFLLDSGWKVFVWIGKDADTSEKLMAFMKGDAYCKKDTRTASLTLEIVKSGKESAAFESYFE